MKLDGLPAEVEEALGQLPEAGFASGARAEFAGFQAAVLTAAGAAQDVGGVSTDGGFFADAFGHGDGVAGGGGIGEFHEGMKGEGSDLWA